MRYLAGVSLAVVVACGRAPAPSQALLVPAPPPALTPADRIASIPDGFGSVGWFRGDHVPLLEFIEGLAPAPACMTEIKAGLHGYVQASQRNADESVIIFQGVLDRAKVEACLQTVGANLGMPITLEQTGPITAFSTSEGKGSMLGWLPDGSVVLSDERAMIDEVLAGKTSVRSNTELMALLELVDPAHAMWAVSTSDLAGLFIDVPSRGFFISGEMPKPATQPGAPRPRFIVSFVFATPPDAAHAVTAFIVAMRDPRFSPRLQAAFVKTAPTAKGNNVDVDIAPFFEDPAVMPELNELLQQMQAVRLQAQTPIPPT